MDVLNFSASERVDLSDLNFVAQDTPLGFAREMGAYFALNPAATQRCYIVSGFLATNPTGNQIQVTLGSAFLGRRVGLDITYGYLTATGDATQAIDVSAFQSGTYGVYVKFDQVPGASENRTFWQAGDSPGEYAQNVPTRLLSTWQLCIVALNPGAEWLQVATLTLPGNALVDTRPLYFEGRPDQSYSSGWGAGTNDRNANRAAYGIGDLQTFTQAMRTAIEDVKGPGLTRWWENKIGGQNIGFSGAPTLGRSAWGDANFYAQGNTAAPAINFDTSSQLSYQRSTQLFSFTPNAQTALTIGPTAATAPLSLVVGNANQLTFKASATTASALYAPASTSVLFEQRATNAALSTLATYAGGTLAGSVDSNRNWILGSGSTGYTYPTSGTANSYAALTVADTSGNHLLRLDSSATSGVPAIMTLRANTAATTLRFTPNATSPSSTYSYAIGAMGTQLTMASAAATFFTYDSATSIADFTGAQSLRAGNFLPASPTFSTFPSIYNTRVAAGTNNGQSVVAQTGGYVAVTGTPNSFGQTVIIPCPLPANATVTACFLQFWRASNNNGAVTVIIWGSKITAPSSTSTVPTAVQLAAYSAAYSSNGGATTGNTFAINNISITPGQYFNYFVSFGDNDASATNYLVSLHVYYTVPGLTAGFM